MRSLFIKLLFIALTCGVSPAILASAEQSEEEYQRQLRGEEQARRINQTIVPIVRDFFSRKRAHTDFYFATPYYNYDPATVGYPYRNLPPGRCFHQRDGGIPKEIPCY